MEGIDVGEWARRGQIYVNAPGVPVCQQWEWDNVAAALRLRGGAVVVRRMGAAEWVVVEDTGHYAPIVCIAAVHATLLTIAATGPVTLKAPCTAVNAPRAPAHPEDGSAEPALSRRLIAIEAALAQLQAGEGRLLLAAAHMARYRAKYNLASMDAEMQRNFNTGVALISTAAPAAEIAVYLAAHPHPATLSAFEERRPTGLELLVQAAKKTLQAFDASRDAAWTDAAAADRVCRCTAPAEGIAPSLGTDAACRTASLERERGAVQDALLAERYGALCQA